MSKQDPYPYPEKRVKRSAVPERRLAVDTRLVLPLAVDEVERSDAGSDAAA